MDFHSLSRRELQALCKKNKIPANVTNVAMADSLKSLEIVEGTDEIFQTCQSGMARLSIKPRGWLETAAPLQPPTSGRSKRGINSEADAFETPIAPQINRKKCQTASACRKMDSLLKESAQEEKTPATSGFTSRRRRAATECSAVQGTRRSARLAEKSAKLLKENGSTNPDFSMNLIERPVGLDEISGVTDVSASTNSEENSVMQDEEHADSAWKQDIATDVELVLTIGGNKPELNESRDVEIKEKEVGSHDLDSSVVDAASIFEEKPETEIQSAGSFEKHVVFSTVEGIELDPSNEGEYVETKDREVGSNNLDLAGIDAVTIVKENPETEIQSYWSCKKQVVCSAEEAELMPSNEGEDIETEEREVGSYDLDSPGVNAASIVEENLETEFQLEGSCEKQVVFTVEEVELEPSYKGEDVETKDRKVGPHNLDLAGIDAVTIVEVNNPGMEIQSECSAEKQVISTVQEVKLVPSNETEMSDSERDGANLDLKESIVDKIEQVTFGSKIVAELDDHNEAQETDGSDAIEISDLEDEAVDEYEGSDAIEMSETVVENDPSGQDSEPEDEAVDECEGSDAIEIVVENDPSDQDSDSEDEMADECEDDFASSEDDNSIFDDKESDLEEVTPFSVNKEMLEFDSDLPDDSSEMESNPDESDSFNSDTMEESTKTDLPEDSSETESNPNESDSVNSDPMEESTKSNDSLAVIPSDLGLMSDVDDAVDCDVILEEDVKILVQDKQLDNEQSVKQVSPGTMLEDAKADEPEQAEIIQSDENVKLDDEVPLLGASDDISDAPSSEEAVEGLNLQNSPTQLLGVGDGVPYITPALVVKEAAPLNFAEPEASLRNPPTKTPVGASASKPSTLKKRMLVPPSDNKENIDSGSKTTCTQERSKVVKESVLKLDDDDQTIMELSQKVEKLEITKKMDKNKGETQVSARPPLQAISGNQ